MSTGYRTNVQITRKYEADFNQLIKVLQHKTPDRPVLFEYFMNGGLFEVLTGKPFSVLTDNNAKIQVIIDSFIIAGYDYVSLPSRYFGAFSFDSGIHEKMKTSSLNSGNMITDWASFEVYPWPDPSTGDFEALLRFKNQLHDGMKFIIPGPCGVLENVIDLVGFDNLCFMIFEDKNLAQHIFELVGSRLLRFYEICASIETVGALIVNDDWGFKTQTLLDPGSLREFVFPWHKKIVDVIKREKKFAILHSCGNLNEMMDDIIDNLGFDGKHSFEDVIIPVEEAWKQWGDRIAIIGGIDMDFLVRSKPQEISKRASNLLNLTGCKSYALGSGNSIPDYVPVENYLAMISVI